MGVVYKARQTPLDRIIAIKMLNAQMADDPNWVQRFFNEAKACSRLQHPNLVRLLRWSAAPPRPYMVLEYVSAQSAAAHLEAVGESSGFGIFRSAHRL